MGQKDYLEGSSTVINNYNGIVLPDYSRFNNCSREMYASLDEIQLRLEKALQEWIDSSDPQFYVAVDGLSGAGKTTLVNILHKIKDKFSHLFEISTLGIELFITTERDSKERQEMLSSSDLFWQVFYNRNAMKNVLHQIFEFADGGGIIHLPKAYQHKIGKFDSIDFKVPQGKKIVIIDGVDTVNLMDEADLKENRLNLFVFTPAELSLLSACIRDAKEKGVDLLERSSHRKGEYTFLTTKLKETKDRSDVLIFHNQKTPLEEQLKRFFQMMDFQKKQKKSIANKL